MTNVPNFLNRSMSRHPCSPHPISSIYSPITKSRMTLHIHYLLMIVSYLSTLTLFWLPLLLLLLLTNSWFQTLLFSVKWSTNQEPPSTSLSNQSRDSVVFDIHLHFLDEILREKPNLLHETRWIWNRKASFMNGGRSPLTFQSSTKGSTAEL